MSYSVNDKGGIMQLSKKLAELSDELAAERERQLGELARLDAEVAAVKADMSSIDKALRPLRPDLYERPAEKPSARAARNQGSVSDETLDLVETTARRLLAQADHVTISDVMLDTGLSNSSTGKAMNVLRDRQVLRVYRTETGGRKLFRLTREAENGS